MTGGNGGLTGDVGQYALEQYRQDSGGGLASVLTLGLSDVVAATRALSAASEAKALSVDPQAVDSMLSREGRGRAGHAGPDDAMRSATGAAGTRAVAPSG